MPANLRLTIALLFFVFIGNPFKCTAAERTAQKGSSSATPQVGVASWYGGVWIGRRTANGERYAAGDLTAAHRTLRFGTFVRVTNLRNSRCVIVRINNRGPFVKGRILDLSKRAATALNMMGSGTAKVRLEVIAPEELAAARLAMATPTEG